MKALFPTALLIALLSLPVPAPIADGAAAEAGDTLITTGSDTGQDDLAFPPGRASDRLGSLAPAPPGMELISVSPVFFAYDKAELDERARRILDQAARHVRHHSMVSRIIIQGHADEVGSTAYNYRLADRRAAAVQDYLIRQGVPAALLYSSGLGEHFPIDESWTREGRRRNRHVEVYIVQYPLP